MTGHDERTGPKLSRICQATQQMTLVQGTSKVLPIDVQLVAEHPIRPAMGNMPTYGIFRQPVSSADTHRSTRSSLVGALAVVSHSSRYECLNVGCEDGRTRAGPSKNHKMNDTTNSLTLFRVRFDVSAPKDNTMYTMMVCAVSKG